MDAKIVVMGGEEAKACLANDLVNDILGHLVVYGRTPDLGLAETPEVAIRDQRGTQVSGRLLKIWIVPIKEEERLHLLVVRVRPKENRFALLGPEKVVVPFLLLPGWSLVDLGVPELEVLATEIGHLLEELRCHAFRNDVLSCLSLLEVERTVGEGGVGSGGPLREVWAGEAQMRTMRKRHGEAMVGITLEQWEDLVEGFADPRFPANLEEAEKWTVKSEEFFFFQPDLFRLRAVQAGLVVELAVLRPRWQRASLTVRLESGQGLTLPQEKLVWGFRIPEEVAIPDLPDSLFREVEQCAFARFLHEGIGVPADILNRTMGELMERVRSEKGGADGH